MSAYAEVFHVQRRGLSAEMIMSNKEYEQAFPTRDDNYDSKYSGPGMTLRDYFAAKALQGWLASYPDDNRHPVIAGNADEVAMNAYQMADAMLRAREVS